MIAHALRLFLISATPASHVAQVVVFPDRAQVTRSVSVSCVGKTSVLFEGLPPAADPSTFRASSSDATVEGLRSETRTREAAYSKPIAQLEAKQDALLRQLNGLQDTLVPTDQSQSMAAALDAAGVTNQLVLVPGGHNLDYPVHYADLTHRLLEFLSTTWNDVGILSRSQ